MGSTGARRAGGRIVAAAASECAASAYAVAECVDAAACVDAAVCAAEEYVAAALGIVSAAAYDLASGRRQAPACVVEFRYAGSIGVGWACARLVVDEDCHSYADLPAFLAVHAVQECGLETASLL